MITISKSKLKAQMLQIFRKIQKSGEEVIVTDHHRPVLRIQPITRKRSLAALWSRLTSEFGIFIRWLSGNLNVWTQ